jgi:hypothetical protein
MRVGATSGGNERCSHQIRDGRARATASASADQRVQMTAVPGRCDVMQIVRRLFAALDDQAGVVATIARTAA